MLIKNITYLKSDASPKGFRPIARFTIVPVEGFCIYDCTLVRAPDGKHLLYGPAGSSGQPTISVEPSLRRQIIDTIIDDMGIDNDGKQAA